MKHLHLLIVTLLLPAVVIAADPPTSPADKGATPKTPPPTHVVIANGDRREIVIDGISEGRTATYKGGILLKSEANVDLFLVQSQLEGSRPKERSTGDQKIAGDSLQMKVPVTSIRINDGTPPPFSLQANTPRLLTISVDTDIANGDLTGTLQLANASVPVDSFPPIPVRLHLTPKPSATFLPAPLTFKTTRCTGPVTCYLASLLTPSGSTRSMLHWQLSDQSFSGAEAKIPSMVSLHGDKSGDIVSLNVRKWCPNKCTVSDLPDIALPGQGQGPIDAGFEVNRNLAPDHYQGQYSISSKGTALLTVPVALDVRNGPLLALAILLLGIVLGRVIQATNSARAQSQMNLLDQYNTVSSAVAAILFPPNKRFLEICLENIRVDIRLMSRPEQGITSELNLIYQLAGDASKLDRLTAQIVSEPDPALKTQLQAALDAAHTAINAKDAATTEAKMADIATLLARSAGEVQRAAAAAARPAPTRAEIGATTSSPTSSTAAPGSTAGAGSPNGFTRAVARTLAWLSGTQPLGVGWYYYGRPLLYFLLLGFLAFVGLYNSYIRNATFGSEGFYDYLSLFLWGISADVAQKSLQQLSLTRTA